MPLHVGLLLRSRLQCLSVRLKLTKVQVRSRNAMRVIASSVGIKSTPRDATTVHSASFQSLALTMRWIAGWEEDVGRNGRVIPGANGTAFTSSSYLSWK